MQYNLQITNNTQKTIYPEDFLYYIGELYENIKANLHKFNFNEDIFHNTIINCFNTIKRNNIIFNNIQEMLNYFYKSFKINKIRDKLYFNNKMRVDNDICDCNVFFKKFTNEDIEAKCLTNILIEKGIQKFGDKLIIDYLNYLYSDNNLETYNKQHHIKNIKLKFNKIKEFVFNELKEFPTYKMIYEHRI